MTKKSVPVDTASTLEDLLLRAEKAALGGRSDEGDDEPVLPSKAEAARPDISRLKDALDEEGFPVFAPGDRIVIERRASFLAGNPYLDTRTYRVKRIDEGNGMLSLWDEAMAQWATDNFIAGRIQGQVYKLAAGDLTVGTKKKRGRPRKNPPAPPKDPNAPAKKRGRPKGSLNRPKDVVAAEKAAKHAARAAKPKKKRAK